MRRIGIFIMVLPFLACLTGCYGITAALAVAIYSLAERGDDGAAGISPLRVDRLAAGPVRSRGGEVLHPDRILVEFRLAGGRGGSLTVSMEYRVLAGAPGCLPPGGHAVGPFLPVPPALEAGLPGPLRAGQDASSIWEAGAALGGESASVELVITPREEGEDGEPRAVLLRVGNTPPRIEDARLGLAQDYLLATYLLATFLIIDAECDRVDIEGLMFAHAASPEGLAAAGFTALSQEVFEDPSTFPRNMRQSLPAHPGGIRSGLSFPLSALAGTALGALAKPGFVGHVRLRMSFRDFAGAALEEAESEPFLLNTNDPPALTLLPIDPSRLQSGVIPIRYRLSDRQGNPADVDVLSLFGGVPRPASEFPLAISSVTRSLDTSDPDRTYTFLWDALAQMREGRHGFQDVVLRVCARDLEEECHETSRFSFPYAWLERAGQVAVGQNSLEAIASADFDGDGFDDLVAANRVSDSVVFLAGGPEGLAHRRGFALDSGSQPTALALGDFNGDSYVDAVAANSFGNSISLFTGGPEGLVLAGPPLAAGSRPQAIASGLLDPGPYVVTANTLSQSVSLFLGGPAGLRPLKDVPLGFPPVAIALFPAGEEGLPAIAVGLGGAANAVRFIIAGPEGFRREGQEETVDVPGGTEPAALAVADFDGDGLLDIAAANRFSDDGTLIRVRVSPKGVEAEGVPFPTGRSPSALAVLDLNGDGFPDLAVANEGSGTVSFLQGGRGGLTLLDELRAGVRPRALAVADHDGDGFPDLTVADFPSGSIHHFQGSPAGPRPAGVEAAGGNPVALAAGDFDGDGAPDLAAGLGSGQLVSFRGGAAILLPAGALEAGLDPAELVAGDFDGDGFLDLLVGNRSSGDVTHFSGGLEGLRRVENIEGLRDPVALASGDFNGDGIADALVAKRRSFRATVLYGRRGGGFTLDDVITNPSSAPTNPRAALARDFDNDGIDDAVVVLDGSDVIAHFRGRKDEGFRNAGNITAGRGSGSLRPVLAGDFDGDHLLDLLVAYTGGVTFLRGDGEMGLVRPEQAEIRTGSAPVALAAADFDGDGWLDALAAHAHAGSGNLTLLWGGPDGPRRLETLEIDLAAGGSPAALAAGDFDGDGFPDALVVIRLPGPPGFVRFLRGGLTGLTPDPRDLPIGVGPAAILCGDLDGDGFLDALVANEGEASLSFMRGGPEGPRLGRGIAAGDGPAALLAGDFDGDGFQEVLAANSRAASVTSYRRLYLTPHASRAVDPAAGPDVHEILDPRSPPRYRLELPAAALSGPQAVCLIPGPSFELPQEEAFARQAYYRAASDPVTLLREDTVLGPAGARLVLRLRSPAADLDRARLHVFRRDPQNGRGVRQDVEIEVIEFEDGLGAAFPIAAFGSYMAALEEER
jgi:hypothetical protein